MDLGFIPTAAPVSQRAPLVDAQSPHEASGKNQDAFDSALASSLAIVDKAASRDAAPVNGQKRTTADWLLAALRRANATDAAAKGTSADAMPGDDLLDAIGGAASDGSAIDDDADDSGDAPVDVSLMPPATVVDPNSQVPVMPVVPVVPAVPVVAAMPVVDASATDKSGANAQANVAVADKSVPPASTDHVADAAATAASVAAGSPAAPQVGVQATEPMPVPNTPSTSTNVGRDVKTEASKAVGAESTDGLALNSQNAAQPTKDRNASDVVTPSATADSANVPRDVAANAAVADVRRPAGRQTRTTTEASASRLHAAPAMTANKGIATSDVASAAAVQAVASAHAAGVTTAPKAPVAPDVTAKVTARASAGTAVQFQSAVNLSAQSDAQMSGGEQFSQGQGRRSPEFMRFAAALSQVAAAGPDDGGRAVAQAVASAVAVAPPVATTSVTAVAATAPTVTLPAGTTPDAENIGRLVQAMRINARPGSWEATVRLKPEHLGDVTIALRVEGSSVSAVVNAEAAGVRQWLESHEQAVRNGMAEHGLQLERFIVQRDGQRRERETADQQPQRRRQRRQAQSNERFEIVV